MHIALGVNTRLFPVQEFLMTTKDELTITTEEWPTRHSVAALTFSGNPNRRGGEWRISDQYTHRHPAWTLAAGFPSTYNSANPPYILVFRVGNRYHVRFALEAELLALGADAPRRLRSDPKGISSTTPRLLSYFKVPAGTLLGVFQAQAEAAAEDAFNPNNLEDGRRWVFAEILRRQGQRDFRRALLKAYGSKCAITGCRTLWVLEAAHIIPYRGARTNTVSNGLLLRADVHTLFDLGLISVLPDTLEVKVSSMLDRSEYCDFHGQTISQPRDAKLRPSKAAIRKHYESFRP